MTEDATPCPLCCKRAPRDTATICVGCEGRIDDDLARIAELVRLAADWTDRRKGTQETTSRPVAGSRPPLDISALDAALGLAGGIYDPAPRDGLVQQAPVVLDVLEGWTRVVREDAGLSPWGVATEGKRVTVKGLVDFLRAWLDWCATTVDFPVDDLAREVRDLRWQLEALDPDRDKPGMVLGCPADHPDADGRLCQYRLKLTPGDANDVHCPRCGTDWTRSRLLLVAQATNGGVRAWATAKELADHLQVGTATVAKWSRRGYVTKMRTRDGWVYDIRETIVAHDCEDSASG